MEVVINSCFGGFSLSNEAIEKYLEYKGQKAYFYTHKSFTIYKKYKEDPKKSTVFLDIFTQDFGETFTYDTNIHNNFYFSSRDIPRDDKDLVRVVRELKKKANGECAELKIVDVPKGLNWKIHEYDGNESVHEIHRSWS